MTDFSLPRMDMPAAPQLPTATPDQRRKINDAAKAFEGQMISQMLQPMFDALPTTPPFGGGAGEATFRSFLVEAIGKQMSTAGGLGLARPVAAEMLKLQGLQ